MGDMINDNKPVENNDDMKEISGKEFIDDFSGFEPISDQDLKKVLGGQEIDIKGVRL